MSSALIKQITTKSPKDIVILGAYRSPITRAVKGGLAKLSPEEILYQTVKGALSKIKIPLDIVDDVLIGTVLQTLGGQKASALAIKSIGFPVSTTVNTCNRQCSSSIQSLSYVGNSIRCEDYKIGIAAGVESMTWDYFPHRGIPSRISENLLNLANQEAKDVLMPMGITSENVALKYGLNRQELDQFAFDSHRKASIARDSGLFNDEIIPITVDDGKVIDMDDGIRSSISIEKLNSLQPAFTKDGLTTAGNSSQISDGGSIALLTTREEADKLGLKPVGRYISSTVAGVEASLMGIAPAFAIPQLLKKLNLELKDISKFELNEAFATQSLYVLKKLNLENRLIDGDINPKGGAIALGHPLGATGIRCLSTLLNSMEGDGELGIVSMCCSTGQGYAGLFVKET
ncbi:hypothetical protein CANARDRAFT_214072 [[Candida] arabinofermentans NRRL YB-2248]|uniref:Uncharacterized protein n=1 Tax=[Candida] arabinofermentans NRRL YB-2248 TaxID=983967 RepID=A0A1E4SWR0_9ASCO|nr:hypothetical protein CANARDRAFT_214072 [[Candida] arabinofermentans NRRL YB-2248]